MKMTGYDNNGDQIPASDLARLLEEICVVYLSVYGASARSRAVDLIHRSMQHTKPPVLISPIAYSFPVLSQPYQSACCLRMWSLGFEK